MPGPGQTLRPKKNFNFVDPVVGKDVVEYQARSACQKGGDLLAGVSVDNVQSHKA